MRVQDWKGNELKVGAAVIYGSPDDTEAEIARHTATVTEISEPDMKYVGDDTHGREMLSYEVAVEIRFDDGETETTWATYRGVFGDEEVFEESGDLVVKT